MCNVYLLLLKKNIEFTVLEVHEYVFSVFVGKFSGCFDPFWESRMQVNAEEPKGVKQAGRFIYPVCFVSNPTALRGHGSFLGLLKVSSLLQNIFFGTSLSL